MFSTGEDCFCLFLFFSSPFFPLFCFVFDILYRNGVRVCVRCAVWSWARASVMCMLCCMCKCCCVSSSFQSPIEGPVSGAFGTHESGWTKCHPPSSLGRPIWTASCFLLFFSFLWQNIHRSLPSLHWQYYGYILLSSALLQFFFLSLCLKIFFSYSYSSSCPLPVWPYFSTVCLTMTLYVLFCLSAFFFSSLSMRRHLFVFVSVGRCFVGRGHCQAPVFKARLEPHLGTHWWRMTE